MNKMLIIGIILTLISVVGLFFGVKEDLKDKKDSGWFIFLVKEFLFGGLTTTFFILLLVGILLLLSGMGFFQQ